MRSTAVWRRYQLLHDNARANSITRELIGDVHFQRLEIPGAGVLQVPVYQDDRGAFYESWRRDFQAGFGLPAEFVQDNISLSHHNVIRGLHLQQPNAQGKLVSTLVGCVWDVMVDVRVGSPTFGRWTAVELAEGTGKLVYVPPGLAHGFAVLSEIAVVGYKCTTYYQREAELIIRWSDPSLAIPWPVSSPILSAKDSDAPMLRELDPDRLPRFELPI
jgi:dTDP-4-dehydrorhamnose 3,5-epimerase